MDQSQARKATRNGAIAAFISAGITLLIVSAALLFDLGEGLEAWRDPLNFLDVAMLVVAGLLVLRWSRIAAIFLFSYFLLAKIYLIAETGQISGLPVALIFLYFFGRAIQGAFVLHRTRRDADPKKRRVPRWVYVMAGIGGFIFLSLVGLGVMSEIGVIPSTEVVLGEDLRPTDRQTLIENGIVSPDEEIRYFYSAGVMSLLEDGNILTDQRVISYEQIEGNLEIYSASFREIEAVEVAEDGDFFNDSIVEVWTRSGDGFRLLLSTENDGDKKFVRAIRRKIRSMENIGDGGTG